MYNEIRVDVMEHLGNAVSSYYLIDIPEGFVEEMVKDIVETSGYMEDGEYNDTDIQYAFGRVLIKHLGAEL